MVIFIVDKNKMWYTTCKKYVVEVRMKKKLCLFGTVLVLVVIAMGLFHVKSSIRNPYEVKTSNGILSYYDSINDFKDKNFSVHTDYFDSIYDSNNNIYSYNNERVGAINILDSTITTYKNIKIGNSINSLKGKLKKLHLFDNSTYVVVFDNQGHEIDYQTENKKDDYILISYFTKDNKITEIHITDELFSRELK